MQAGGRNKMKNRENSGEVIVGLMFLFMASIPAFVVSNNKREEKLEEWRVMEEKLKDSNEPKYYHKVVETWELRKDGEVLEVVK
jgi:hypothetical protein